MIRPGIGNLWSIDRPGREELYAAFQVSLKLSPAGSSVLGRASTVEPLTISIEASGYEEIVPLEVILAAAPVKVTEPKLARLVSEQLREQTSGRSTIHSAEDFDAPLKVTLVE